MPTKRSEELKVWERMMEACRANQADLPGVDEMLDPLAALVVKVRVLEVIRTAMRQTVKETTQNLSEVQESGRESARRLRNYVKSRLGTRNERLTRFGIGFPGGQAPKKQGGSAPRDR
jgi:hypothetical protein